MIALIIGATGDLGKEFIKDLQGNCKAAKRPAFQTCNMRCRCRQYRSGLSHPEQ